MHVAARKGQAISVQALLSQPGIDTNIVNKDGHTPLEEAKHEAIGVFKQIERTCNEYPANSYGKVILCGSCGAGKSSLAQVIVNFSKPIAIATHFVKHIFGQQAGIGPTVGINYHQVNNRHSNMVIFDLAGNHRT